MVDKMKCKIVTFNEVYSMVKEISEQVKATEFKTTTIIGLARGGWIPARLICDFLGITDLISLKVEHWLQTGKTKDEATIRYPLTADLKGKKLLIILQKLKRLVHKHYYKLLFRNPCEEKLLL